MNYKPQIYSNWGLTSNSQYSIPIEIYVDVIPINSTPENTIRIIQIQESHTTKEIVDYVQKNKNSYDYIFTYYEDILKNNPKAIKFLCINTWIKDYMFPEKEFGVSTIVGGKNYNRLLGHELRHKLWARREEIITPKKFYLSSQFRYGDADYSNNLVLGNTKNPLFDTMFHIVIENASINNMFTEKLIDCFQTKTIPIYWGAPNIGEYFNIDGMLIGKDVDDLIKLANSVTPELYDTMKDVIEDNYNRSMSYLDHTQILDNKLKELFN